MKPDFAGLICAYCGIAKLKLYSNLKTVKELVIYLQTNGVAKKQWDDFVEDLIKTYKSGKKKVRVEDLKQRIVKENEVEFAAGVKGVLKLYQSYFDKWGDPATNGKGHTVKVTKWKDGSVQRCVFMPKTAEDEMEAEWNQKNRTKHEAELHNGEMMADNQQLAKMMAEITLQKGNDFTGVVVPEMSSSSHQNGAGDGKDAGTSGEAAADGSKGGAGDDEEEEEEEDGDETPADLMDLCSVDNTASVAEKAEAKANGKAKGKAKAKAKGDKSMPPALSKAIRAGAVAKGRKAVPIVAGEDGKQTEKLLKSQTEKAEGMIDKFETAQRATLVGLDKKFFKEVKQLTEKIEGRLVLATPSARTQVPKPSNIWITL